MFFLLLGCTPADDSRVADAPTWVDPDGATLTVSGSGVISWTHADGTERNVEIGLGVVGTIDSAACSYDPWWLYDDRVDEGTIASESYKYDLDEDCTKGTDLVGVVATTWTGSAYALEFEDGSSATLEVDNLGPGLRLSLDHDDSAGWAPYAWARVSAGADEEFYGLGETFDRVRQRGTVRAMQIELATTESAYNEVHVPVPLLVSSANWGMLVDSYRPGVFDVAASDDGAVTTVFQQLDGDFAVDLYAPERAAQVTGRYWQRTGEPEVPPDWAFAPLQWQDEVTGQDEVLDDAYQLRSRDLPTGVIWVDNPWQTTYNSLVPDPAMFPDWTGMIESLHAQGFRMLAWTTPYVDEVDPEWQSYSDSGWFVEDVQLFSGFGNIVDLTNPDAKAAWAGRVEAARDIGIEGWKLDYGEDVQLGVNGARLPGWIFDNGEDERTMHHQFAMYFHAPYAEPYREQGILIGRAGCLGGQALTDVIWPGDLDNGFETWGDEGCEDGTCIGGLRSAVHGGTALSTSGYPFFASDTGGYRGGRPSKESFIRWTEYAATLPVWQYGGDGENHNPWDFTEYEGSQFDQEVLDAFERYARLHIRLWPYFQVGVARMLANGVPIVLPQGLADPDGGVHTDTTFFVGDDLFVAPVVDEGVDTVEVTLPSGNWVHWWTGERYSGSERIDAPLGFGAIFQREGSAIPMLRRSVETLSPVSDDTVDSWYNEAGALNARVVPGEGAGFTLASGESLSATTATDIALLSGSLYAGWDIEVYAPGASRVTVDGEALSEGEEGCSSCFIIDDPWVRAIFAAGESVSVE